MVFEVDRIIFDRSLWVVYYPSVIQNVKKNLFDPDLIRTRDLQDDIKYSKYKGKGKEAVLFREKGNPSYIKTEMRLRGPRSMIVYFNFNRYFFQINGLKHTMTLPVLNSANFLPLESKITINDFYELYKLLHKELSWQYEEQYNYLWPREFSELKEKGECPVVKCVTLEVARELYPLDVNTLKTDCQIRGTKFTSYNSASNIMYFGEAPTTDIKTTIDNATINGNIECYNMRDPYEKHPVQLKVYQKSIFLGRVELTLYDEQIDFNSIHPIEDIKFTLDQAIENFGLCLTPFQRGKDEILSYLAAHYKLSEAILYTLASSGGEWISTKANRMLTDKLRRKKLLTKESKGVYRVNNAFMLIFKDYIKPEQKNVYIPKYLS